MKNLKKLISILLILSLVACMSLALVSCSGDGEGEGSGDGEGEGSGDGAGDGKITYTVTVKDMTGNAVKGVKVQLKLDNVAPIGSEVTTGEDGVATFRVKNEGSYYACVTSAPAGFILPTTGTKLVDNAATVTLEKLPEYTVYVKDASGNPIAGVGVQICSLSGACQLPKNTDSDGKIVSNLERGDYQAKIVSAPQGYEFTDEYFLLVNNTVTVVLQAK